MRGRHVTSRFWRAGAVILGMVVVVPLLGPPPAAAATWQAVNTIAGTGLAASAETSHASPVDFDGDGRQDVFVVYHDRGAKLWRNNGNGTYTRVAADA